ncbi:hypothetical protein LCGC14_2106660 [marine sediment metagenome]|uniref:Uncharacterized protein n=1 Tax=marine sediment metagenome TaxID=412755 RepID=A0A0F9E8C3_9ZZZZ
MKMIKLKATLEGGTWVSVSVLDQPVITLHKSSGDQREPAGNIQLSMEEWDEVRTAVRELLSMVGASEKPDVN